MCGGKSSSWIVILALYEIKKKKKTLSHLQLTSMYTLYSPLLCFPTAHLTDFHTGYFIPLIILVWLFCSPGGTKVTRLGLVFKIHTILFTFLVTEFFFLLFNILFVFCTTSEYWARNLGELPYWLQYLASYSSAVHAVSAGGGKTWL